MWDTNMLVISVGLFSGRAWSCPSWLESFGIVGPGQSNWSQTPVHTQDVEELLSDAHQTFDVIFFSYYQSWKTLQRH